MASEIWIYLALFLFQNIVLKLETAWYWSKKKILSTPFFAEVMSEQRFSLISKFLHFSNNETMDEETHPCWKLRKIWPIYSFLLEKFRTLYTPERDISIDESLMLHKGRLSWKQYIPLKRARFRLKFYMLCESDTGYIWNYILYTGKGMILSPDFNKENLTSQIVLSLIQPLLNKGYCLTADNFYMSPDLCDKLISFKTDSYGTVRVNRKDVPKEMQSSKLRKGDIIAFQRGKLIAMKWKDKKDVHLLSTIHNIEMSKVSCNGKVVEKPKVVIDYNLSMGGVDRADQNLSYYETVRKRMKVYYKKLFRHMIDQCLFNSSILQSKVTNKNIKLLDFQTAVIEEILRKYQVSTDMTGKTGRKSDVNDPLRLTGRHFADYIPATPCKREPTRRCVVCYASNKNGKKIRKETRIWCPDCEVALCNIPCFKIYHTQRNY